MGSGSMKRKSYITNTGYYLAKDFDEKFGGDFYFLLTPLYGNNNERFFFIEENPDGSYTVEGECYIVTNEESLKRHKRDVKKEVSNKPIWYYHVDENRTVIRKEKHISP